MAKTGKSAAKPFTVSSALVQKIGDSVTLLADYIKTLIKMERKERELLLAVIDANKAQNLLDHTDEIKNRPKKDWFVSMKQKKTLRDMSREEIEAAKKKLDNKKDRMKDKKKELKQEEIKSDQRMAKHAKRKYKREKNGEEPVQKKKAKKRGKSAFSKDKGAGQYTH